MHFVINWEIRSSDKPQREELSALLRKCLSGYSWVKPLSNCFIIKVRSEADRVIIVAKMVTLAKENPSSLYFVASPLMKGGKYRGWLPRRFWAMINKRVQDVEQQQ
jgi:hypothetical protein